jgi:hypothetical protein
MEFMMRIRILIQAALLSLIAHAVCAAADCAPPANAAQGNDTLTDWYAKYIAPLRGLPDATPPSRAEIESLIEKFEPYHRRGVSDPLFFESLVQQITASFTNTGDFKGLTTAAAEKLYRGNSGTSLDFSMLCIDVRRGRFADDTFAITLFGVSHNNCQHASLRGLVFSSTLVNGSSNGACRPDHSYRRLLVPVVAGTNSITFVCNKDALGCAGR